MHLGAPWIPALPALPLLGALALLLLNRRLGRLGAGLLASATVGLSFLISLGIMGTLLDDPATPLHNDLYTWISALDARVAFTADTLSASMAAMVSGVGLLIHIYSIGYMDAPDDDPRCWRYFAVLNGFVASMLVLVLAYIAFRFDLAFAPGAVLALFHDVAITIGIFVIFHREVNLPIIGALLTIIGYSLNDTIVIYDRIRENMERYRRTDLQNLINKSVNETLNRTVNTSLTTFLAIVFFLLWGGPVIQTFAMAMLIGVVVGTYSTVYVASPMILVMQDLKPRIAKIMSSAESSSPEVAAGQKGRSAISQKYRDIPGDRGSSQKR